MDQTVALWIAGVLINLLLLVLLLVAWKLLRSPTGRPQDRPLAVDGAHFGPASNGADRYDNERDSESDASEQAVLDGRSLDGLFQFDSWSGSGDQGVSGSTFGASGSTFGASGSTFGASGKTFGASGNGMSSTVDS